MIALKDPTSPQVIIGELLGLMDDTGFQAPEISSAEPHMVKWRSSQLHHARAEELQQAP
jgi:hypothetical protein